MDFRRLGLKYRFIVITIAVVVLVTLAGSLTLHGIYRAGGNVYRPEYLMAVAAFYIFIGIIGVLLVSKYMIQPVVHLTQKVYEVRNGNLDIEFSNHQNHVWMDEMDQLYEGFAHMVRHLRQTIEELTKAKERAETVSRELYKSKKRLEAVFNSLSDGIMIIDKNFRIVTANPVILKLMGRTEEEIKGKHCFEMCNGSLRRCQFCRATDTFRFGEHEITYCTKPDPSGKGDRILEVHDFPMFDENGEIVQIIEYVKDVTDAMQMQAKLESSRRLAEIGEMAAKVAHEVRNPLNAIKGATHYLRGEIQEESVAMYLDLIEEQVDRVNRVATDLLGLARPLEPVFHPGNLEKVIRQALWDTQQALDDKQIRVKTHIHPNIPEIPLDENQIEQALVNLILNAVDAMEEGGQLTIELKSLCGGNGMRGEHLQLVIADTGCGIPAETREQIFQPFFTTKIKGTGLGLTIVKKIVEHHQGQIEIESEENQGTRVIIRLPLNIRHHEAKIYNFSS
ncbi:MAG: PAS domain-containing protein [Calditrichaeota bacterium]|nr:PAS domain-containing protein [Calditrichota bacterium]